MIDALWFFPVYGIALVITWFPLRVQLVFSDFLFFLIYRVGRYRKDTVYHNLKKSFPGKSEQEIHAIALAYYHHFCDYIVESLSWIRISKEEAKKRFVFKNREVIDELFSQGKSILLTFGHSGNWEWLSNLPLYFPSYQVIAIYKPLSNKYVNRFFIRIRERFGVQTVPMATSLRKIVEFDKKKIPTMTLVLTDQRPMINQIEYWTTFMNQDTPILLGTEKISKKLDFAVVFMDMRKTSRSHYEGTFLKITDRPRETAPYEITEKHVRALEHQIMEQPETWLWSHKRWKYTRQQVADWQAIHLKK